MAKKKNRKVVRYRRPLNINVGMIIFALIFAYMAFYVYTYVRRDKIEFYEVTEGGIVNDQRHTGVILREETVQYTDRAGNINFYLQEGKRAAVGTRIYSIDETGTISSLLAEQAGDSISLSSENLASLQKELSAFSQTFRDEDFHEVYDVKYTLDSRVLEYASSDALKNLDSILSEAGANFSQVRSSASGVVSYSIDSMESLEPSQITAETFDRSLYAKIGPRSGQLVETGAPAYKLITSEDWSVVFQLSSEEAALYQDKDSLALKFSGKDLETTAAFSIITGADGGAYGKLDFNKYMEQFVSDRFVDFEIITEEVKGLKLPRTAVTTMNFFIVPRDFYASSENGSASGFYKEVYGENGSTMELISPTIYNADEEYYYLDTENSQGLKAGDYLIKPDSQERYQVGVMESVQGVFNINRGYTIFRKIEILNSNDEFYTVAKGTDYGLSVYDHIVLDASSVAGNGVVIYQ